MFLFISAIDVARERNSQCIYDKGKLLVVGLIVTFQSMSPLLIQIELMAFSKVVQTFDSGM